MTNVINLFEVKKAEEEVNENDQQSFADIIKHNHANAQRIKKMRTNQNNNVTRNYRLKKK